MAHQGTARRTTTMVVLTCALALGACSNDPEPIATPTETESSASASPSPTLRPVVGERTITVLPLGGRPLLGLGGNPEPDQASIEAVTTTVGDWLDAHLDRLQRDGKGLWGQLAAEGLANGEQRRQVTTHLASPDAPVRSARYVMTVYQDGAPQYLTAKVEVTHPDDSVTDVGLVFVVDDEGTPVLSLFGPDPVAKAAE